MKANKVNRRSLIKGLSSASIGAIASASVAKAVCAPLTAPQTEGPFYPIEDQEDVDWDLTRVKGNPNTAKGEVIVIDGIIIDQNCEPVQGALVEIWQACATGRYNHPSDPNTTAELDQNFQYWGQFVTDEEGRYTFKTIRPGHYPATPEWIRPAHIHYKVNKRGYQELTTQMYFDDDPYNEDDRILQALTAVERDGVVVSFRAIDEVSIKTGQFDITIEKLV